MNNREIAWLCLDTMLTLIRDLISGRDIMASMKDVSVEVASKLGQDDVVATVAGNK